MTRKRYVKLLMACGLPRNYCQAAAWVARESGPSYRTDMEDWLNSFRIRRLFALKDGDSKYFSRCIDILRQALGVE